MGANWLLISSVVLSFLNAFLTAIIKLATSCFWQVRVDANVRDEVIDIKQQMSMLSRIDNLAKYIKLERKLIKLVEQQKSNLETKIAARRQVQTVVTYTLQAILTLLCAGLLWAKRGSPVVILPSHWLSPLDGLLSWPTNTPGGIGFPVWFLITNTVTKSLAKPFV